MSIPVRIAATDRFHADAEALFDSKTLKLRPVGTIDETFPQQELSNYITKLEGSIKRVFLDLGEVQRMSSAGAKLWVKLLNRIQSRMSCQLSNVGEVFLEQAIVYPDILGKAGTPVTNLLAPYHCKSCGDRQNMTWNVSDLRKTDEGYVVPSGSCNGCGSSVEFDAFEADYYELFQRMKQV